MPPHSREPSDSHAGSKSDQNIWKGLLAGTLCSLIWGVQAVVSRRGILDGLTAIDITAIRFAVSGILLLPSALKLRPAIVGPIGWRRATILFLLAGAPYSLLLIGGVTFAPAIHSAVVFSGLNPVAALLLATAISRRMPTRSKVFGTSVVILGLGLFAWNAVASTGADAGAWRGDVLFASAAACFALFGALLARWKIGPLEYLAPVCVVSMLTIPIWGLGHLHALSSVGMWPILLQAVYQGALVSIVSLLLFAESVSLIGAVRASMFVPLAPLATALFGALFLAEIPTRLETAGMCLVIVGIVWGTRDRAPIRARS